VKHESVLVQTIPSCDFDPEHGDAAVEGKTAAGPWAYMCDGCFVEHGIGLGLGKGQQLVLAPSS
jgi:hypothetical protein